MFYKESLDVWKLLHQKPSLFSSNERTDMYILCTESVSIKFRHGENLEFKIRERRHDSGAELWRKVEFHNVTWRKNPNIKLLQSLVVDKLELVARGCDQELQPLLTHAVQHVRGSWNCIEVTKSRQNIYYAGLHVEQTNICLTGKDDRWQTICFEGSLENILKFLTSSHGKQIIAYDFQVKGYPEFLCTIE